MKRLVLILSVLFLSTSVYATNSFIKIEGPDALKLYTRIGGIVDYYWFKDKGWVPMDETGCGLKLKKSSLEYWNPLLKTQVNDLRARGGLVCASLRRKDSNDDVFKCTLEENLTYCQIDSFFKTDFRDFLRTATDNLNTERTDTIKIGSVTFKKVTKYSIDEITN